MGVGVETEARAEAEAVAVEEEEVEVVMMVMVMMMCVHPHRSYSQGSGRGFSSWEIGVGAVAVSLWNQVVTRRLSSNAVLSCVKQSSERRLNESPLRPPIHRLGDPVDYMRTNATNLISVFRFRLTALLVSFTGTS